MKEEEREEGEGVETGGRREREGRPCQKKFWNQNLNNVRLNKI